jgi:hypothetical protein
MKSKKFSNQSVEQILKHLENFLDHSVNYDLSIDPLGVNFSIKESTRRRRSKRKKSEKRKRLREEQKGMTKRQKRLIATKKRTRPKIRSVKKGRAVILKGRIY